MATESGTAAGYLRPLQVSTTTFTITTDGDPILRARYVFHIDD